MQNSHARNDPPAKYSGSSLTNTASKMMIGPDGHQSAKQ